MTVGLHESRIGRRHPPAGRLARLLVALLWLFAVGAEAETLTLRQAVEMVMADHLAVDAESDLVRQAEVDVELARQLRRPDIAFKGRTGLVPEAKGDVFDSPDSANSLSGLGVFWRFEVSLIQPISTFGKIPAARQAAENAVRLRRLGRRDVAQNMGYQVVRAFWALQAANRGRELASDLLKDYRKLVPEVEEAVADEDSEVDDTNLLEVKSLEYGIVLTLQKTVQGQAIAIRILESLLDTKPLDSQVIAAVETPVLAAGEEWPTTLEARALTANALLNKARAGLDVQAAQLAFTRAAKRPDFFLAAGGIYAEAPNRTDQKNPFVFDPFNLKTAYAFLGLRWNLNFATHRLRTTRGELEQERLETQVRLLEERTGVEVATALAEVQANSILLDTARSSLKSAKSWVRLSGDNWDLGLGGVKRLLDAYDRYYELAAVSVEREAAYHLALARLAYALGDIGLYLEWTENGTISFN